MSRSGSKLDIFVKLSLVFCLMLLAFSMGTYVGKQVSDTDYKQKQLEVEYAENMKARDADTTPAVNDQEIAALAEDMVKAERTVASEADHTEPGAAPAPAHDDEGYKPMNSKASEHPHAAAPSKPEVPKHEAHAAAPSKPEAPKHEAHTAPKKESKDPIKTAADRVAESLAPAADPKPVRQPSTQLPTVATSAIGKYTVQVASYASETEAREHTAKLKEKGFPAFYVPAEVQGRNWYRVSVGLFAAQKAAMDYRQEILKSQATSTAIVQRIVK